MNSFSQCKICGSNIPKEAVIASPDNSGLGDLQIVKCNHCGLRFVPEQLDASQLKSVYAHHTIDYWEDLVQTGSSGERLREILSLLRRWQLDLNGCRLLDIGAGSGHFCHLAGKAGADVIGVEPGHSAVAYGRKKWSVNLVENTFEGYASEASDDLFDIITAWEVIEHIVDLHGFFRRVKQLLRPGGAFLLSTPNGGLFSQEVAWRVAHLRYVVSGKLKSYPELDRRHLQLLSHSHLQRLSAAHGMELINITYRDLKYWNTSVPYASMATPVAASGRLRLVAKALYRELLSLVQKMERGRANIIAHFERKP